MIVRDDTPIILFETRACWADWIELNPQASAIWVRIAKKKTGIKSIYYEDALEVALCYGWIDGIRKKYDEVSFIQRFTPRKSKSLWSKKNKNAVQQLMLEGKMKASGLATIEAARKNGMWDNAYESQSNIIAPDDFKKELAKSKEAEIFFNKLNRMNRYAILHRIEKTKTNKQRTDLIEEFVAMLSDRKKLY
jgi:uncharacterized protein YdeI (YjbR/CyaY-like superfamily)